MKRGCGRNISEPGVRGRQKTFPRPSCWGVLLQTSQIPLSQCAPECLSRMRVPSTATARRKPWRSWSRDTATPSAPHHQHVREPSKGQVCRKKYLALPASQLVLDILLGKGKFLLYFLLSYSSCFWAGRMSPHHVFFIPPCYARTHTQTQIKTPQTPWDKLLICIWEVDCRGILFKNLEGPVLPVWLSLQSTNSPLLLLLCLPVEKISKPYLQIFLPLGPLPNAVLLRLSLFH